MRAIPTNKIMDIIKEAGKIMLSAHNVDETDGNVLTKEGSSNFVTVYDIKVQRLLIEKLTALMPEADFLAEEKENSEEVSKGFTFCIDPIDGTNNFIFDYHCSTISVGLLYNAEVVFGAVYNPYTDEMFYAEKGKGAYLNQKAIRCGKHPLENSLVGIGMSPYCKDTLTDHTMAILKECFLRGVDVRRSGSAALDLCYVASGRIGCFMECVLSPWDYAAGVIIIKEAGGDITQFDGSPVFVNKPCSVIAASQCSYNDFKALVNYAFDTVEKSRAASKN